MTNYPKHGRTTPNLKNESVRTSVKCTAPLNKLKCITYENSTSTAAAMVETYQRGNNT